MPLGIDLRSKTTIVCAFFALLIAATTLLRGRIRPVHFLFAAFAADIGLWYLFQAFFGFFQAPIWERVTLIPAVLLPWLAVRLFEAMVPDEGGRKSRLSRFALVLVLPMAVLVVVMERSWAVRGALLLYVFAVITAGFFQLGRRGKGSPSRATQRRVRLLVVIGVLAGLASVADFAWILGLSLPPVGAVLSIVFLFVLYQALRRNRLLDMSELLGRLFLATVLASLLAVVCWVLFAVLGTYSTMYLNAVLFGIIVLVLFEPLREFVEERIQRRVFFERYELDRSVVDARRRLVHTLEVDDLGSILMAAFEGSRRMTHAVLYLRDQDATGFDRVASTGPGVPDRIEVATGRALLDRLDQGPLSLEEVRREAAGRRAQGGRAEGAEAILTAAEVLGTLKNGTVLAIRAEGGELVGLLALADDRVRDAFSPEEVGLLESLAAQVGVVVENSRLYAQMKERDRLAVLGQMAAGLAHEIRNPLGAIKGAAQLLAEPSPEAQNVDPASREFLGIILEEVERLDRVVGSVLDLARPHQGTVVPTDVNAVVRRTAQVLSTERAVDLAVELHLDAELPRVAVDPEQLRQVVMNLVKNAAQAMKGRGKVTIASRVRFGRGTRPNATSADGTFVELAVTDNGPGISQKVLENIFLPFFTTKEKGTGLGLAISQRIVQGAGGRIEVRSYEGKGSTFAVILPVAMEALGTPKPAPVVG